MADFWVTANSLVTCEVKDVRMGFPEKHSKTTTWATL